MYERSDTNGFWMEDDIWNSSKGLYAREVGLDIHFDDSKIYLKYFPDNCTYIVVPPNNFTIGILNACTE